MAAYIHRVELSHSHHGARMTTRRRAGFRQGEAQIYLLPVVAGFTQQLNNRQEEEQCRAGETGSQHT